MVATGGTISMLIDPDTGRRRPALTGRDLFQSVSGLPEAVIDFYQPYKIASHEVTFSHWARLARCVREVLPDSDGTVVIHGTDTLEEAAFFLAESLSNPDVVCLGAMRPSGHLGEDGPRNLRDAAIAALAGKTGVCVCMNRAVLPAWSVVKADTVAFDAFRVRAGGPLGRVHDGYLHFESAPMTANWLGDLPEGDLSADGVAVLPLAADPSRRQIVQLLRGSAGVVVDSIATGSIPSSIRGEILAAAADIPVVVTSRCFAGPVHDEEDYPHAWDDLLAAGIVLENILDTYKARVRLTLALALRRRYVPFSIEPERALP